MMRWDIINYLIKKNDYKSFLEIGYYKGWSFDRIECTDKTAVDPNPSKTERQTLLGYGASDREWCIDEAGVPELNYDYTVVKLTSDDFFSRLEAEKLKWSLIRDKWDLIFIDGDHHSEQVDKDIQNSLKHLSLGGTIIMHDCSPSNYEMTTTGTSNGEWTGDVYKSFIKFKNMTKCQAYVVDTDFGVGIIKPFTPAREDRFILCCLKDEDINWDSFFKNRRKYLSLLSVNEFMEHEQINQEVNV
jgi:hypothetical protein